ncbi:MAG: hypothetical protein VW580_06610, partial [Flavobacteriaceae bacterium]
VKASARDSPLLVSVKIGKNAEVSVPSPNILRNKFGKVNARMNASPINETPKQLKKRISLPSPKKRERRVRRLTTER